MTRSITADDLLSFYQIGVFPMAEHRDDPDIFLVDPEIRGVLPLDAFHIPRKLRKVVRNELFDIRVDTSFARVMDACAEPTPERPSTWINTTIFNLYNDLHKRGYAHCVECWQGESLVGGLYGVALQGVFFGESMFSRVSEASKVALVYLVDRLKVGGFKMLDAQFSNPHLEQFGIEEIPKRVFKRRLSEAMRIHADFDAYDSLSVSDRTGASSIQRITQTS